MNWYKLAKSRPVWFSGPLKRTRKGFYYIDVPGTIASAFNWMIPDEDVQHPKDKWDNYVGAHISVFYPNEIEGKTITELGDDFTYEITGFEQVRPSGESYTVYFVEVNSPELKALRKKYDLSPLLNGVEAFHITVAVGEDE